jgi:hypothetical protein
MPINVKDAQFGAVGDGSRDDAPAIQRAIDFAKTRSANPFAAYLATVYFPAGYYLINSPINLTNASGIWLVGDGGPYLNSIILGNTGNRPMFDFSGSSQSGCENFTFLPVGGTGNTPSTIGVLFALTSNGGLNCGIKRCYFQMADSPTVNGGLGSVGLVNVRSEEFYVHECLIRANSPVILSYSSNILVPNANYTVSSGFQTLASGTGSMGVTNIIGTSLQGLQKLQPALILQGTNSLNFQGYLSRLSAASGANETAILCTVSTSNLKVHATVESFSRVLQVQNSGFESSELNIVAANAVNPAVELLDVTNSVVTGLKLKVSQPVVSERNRVVLYHAPANGNTQQAAGSLSNCEIYCVAVPNNNNIISANLLKRSTNVTLNTQSPFEKRGGRLRQLTNNRVSFGVVGNITTSSVFQFQEARLPTNGGNNSGYYRIWVDGVAKAGGYGSGAASTLAFQAQIVINQKYDGTLDTPSITVITLDMSTSNPAYLSVNGIVASLSFSNGVGSVSLCPRVSGSGTGEPVYYEGFTEIQSDFFINDPIPLV